MAASRSAYVSKGAPWRGRCRAPRRAWDRRLRRGIRGQRRPPPRIRCRGASSCCRWRRLAMAGVGSVALGVAHPGWPVWQHAPRLGEALVPGPHGPGDVGPPGVGRPYSVLDDPDAAFDDDPGDELPICEALGLQPLGGLVGGCSIPPPGPCGHTHHGPWTWDRGDSPERELFRVLARPQPCSRKLLSSTWARPSSLSSRAGRHGWKT